MVPYDDSFKSRLEAQAEEIARRQAEVESSDHCKQAQAHFQEIVAEYLATLKVVSIMALRLDPAGDKNVMLRLIDHAMESALAIKSLVENAFHRPARREMRFLLESSVRLLHADGGRPSGTLEEKLELLDSARVTRLSDLVDDIDASIADSVRANLRSDVSDLYSFCCSYAHPSKALGDEFLQNSSKETFAGMDSAKELTRTAKQLFRIFDISLFCHFHALGLHLADDLFKSVYDKKADWPFRSGRYVSSL